MLLTFPSVWRNCYNFQNLLDMSPHLASFVRCLELFDSPIGIFPVHTQWRTEERGIIHNKVLHTWLPLLQKLQALTLTIATSTDLRSTWTDMPLPLVSAIRSVVQYPSLVHVDMEGTSIVSILQNTSSTVKHLVVHTGDKSFDLEWLGAALNCRLICWKHCLKLTCNPHQFESGRTCIYSLKSNISFCRLKKLVVSIEASLLLDRTRPHVLTKDLRGVGWFS
ncbi:hypothetical protein CPB83DRAFT_856197 [Crepidotus variabilis]|uniref:Uncharacterized protein n=1 Tax=Crepidotus variabilis TaxID=179855 RepID=A0A9P6JPC0_9AGAR|nr:hypothetical protein CPB83DRAFT_856197 [Crepidotus variabilis]